MTAAATYAAHIDAVSAQRLRIHGPQPPRDRFGGPVAQRFRGDPHRSLDANVQVIASYVQPDDVLIDVGGGAGRVSLPLALRCRQVINIDASPGMLAEFEACAAEAGITNARAILTVIAPVLTPRCQSSGHAVPAGQGVPRAASVQYALASGFPVYENALSCCAT